MTLFQELCPELFKFKSSDRLDLSDVFGSGWEVGTKACEWMQSWKAKTLRLGVAGKTRSVYLLGRRGDLMGCASVVAVHPGFGRDPYWDVLYYWEKPSVVEARLKAGPAYWDSERQVPMVSGTIGAALREMQTLFEPIPEDPPRKVDPDDYL